MFATMLKIFAIIAALSGHISGVTVTAPQSMVNVTVGGNATLLCTYTTTKSLESLFIQWSFYSAKEKQPLTIYYFQNGQAYEYGEFKNRINGTTNQGNASITISNMQPSDTGLYTCEVFSPEALGGQNQKSVAVSVLVKPSQPHCSLRGTPETGHLVSLSCYSEEGMPAPTYQWYKVSEGNQKPVTEQFNTKTGLLIIGNLTTFEAGYYRCTASNSLGNSSCEVDLTAAHSEGGLIAGALIGAILGAVVICIVVWFLTKREKKKERKEKAANSEMQPMTQKQQANVEYANIPTQENESVATATPSRQANAANEYSTAAETAASGMPENDEMQGVETQTRA
ncbi:V-set and immunoglobulin domain-containing protein 1 isoform X2 [Malaclemys terrapin pileata]|uniref:V-set and immunoglobulin domain-containing protein 1 isoform X2 n=1 Tax=Malaclemys terrapin pileata TaxID=2991368 RepID=UPI0023A7A454|nr:V-set and immunoglobulin domain-containing protein 1 isoform X2 [Malaclemys terrapin pileata]